MAGTKISALTAAAALGGTEAIPGVQSAANVKITATQIKTFASASPTLVTPVLGVATGTSLALGGATIGSDALAVTGATTLGDINKINGAGYIGDGSGAQVRMTVGPTPTMIVNSTGYFGFSNGNVQVPDVFWTRGGAATFQHGSSDATSPIAQTIKFQDVVAGTSNAAGVDAFIHLPAGTGTGAGGSLIIRAAAAGSTGSAKNAWATALSIAHTGVATFTSNLTAANLSSGGNILLTTDAGRLLFGSSNDTILARDGAGILAQRNGTNAQEKRVYNTYTDASNGEWVSTKWNANTATIVTNSNGTGAVRSLAFGVNGLQRWIINTNSHFIANVDNSYDIGADGVSRPRTGYFGTGVVIGGATLGANALAVSGNSHFTGTVTSTAYMWIASNTAPLLLGSGADVYLTRGGAAATLQHGAGDTASPVAQTIKFQDVVAGTSNTAGVNATIQAPAGTGTGAGGSLIFQVAAAGSTGSAKNPWTTAMTINSAGLATFTAGLNSSIVQTSNINNSNNTRTFLTFASGTDTAVFGTGMTTPIFQLGGTTSSFPALKRNGATINFRLADDSADAAITASTGLFSNILTANATVQMTTGWYLKWSSLGGLTNNADGATTFANNAGTSTFTATAGANNLASFNGPIKALTTTVAALPTAGTVGRRAFVTDALTPVSLATVSGGGAVPVPVYDDGTAWRVG